MLEETETETETESAPEPQSPPPTPTRGSPASKDSDVAARPGFRSPGNKGTPLREACAEGHTGTVAMLLSRGADPDLVTGEAHETALMDAAYFGHADAASLLLRHRAHPNHCDIHGTTALMDAASQGHLAVCRVLAAMGANLAATDRSEATAHDAAAAGDQPDLARFLDGAAPLAPFAIAG